MTAPFTPEQEERLREIAREEVKRELHHATRLRRPLPGKLG
ncbi:hypothetical protein ACSMXM_05610 [Pacificimonas sp. ICDLI1SI03]